jgi:hypothetical protein
MDELNLVARFGIDDIDGSDDGAVRARVRTRVVDGSPSSRRRTPAVILLGMPEDIRCAV